MKTKHLFTLALISTTLLKLNSQTTNTFSPNGNVGIGTTAPSVPFEIAKTLTVGATVFKFGNPQQNNQILFKDRAYSSFLYGIQSNQLNIGVTGNDHQINSVQANANNITFWPTFAVNSSSNILINPTGNVGINKTAPAYKLDVNGAINATQFLINGSPFSASNPFWLASTTNSNNIYYNTGNIGIGTSAPSVPLQIGTTLTQGATVFNFGNPQQYNQISFRDRDKATFLYGAELGQIKIGLSGTDHKLMSTQANSQNIELYPTVAVNSPSNILINAGQNVGISNTNPLYKLDVSGTVNATQYLVNGNPLPTLSGSGNTFYLPTTASLGIGTNSPQYPLDVAGNARIQNNLYVGGGIVITDNLHASQTVTTSMLSADTLHSTVVTGNTRFTGNINSIGNMTVVEVDVATLNAAGDVTANSKLTVQGNASFNGVLKNSSLAGTGDRIVYVDASGNLKVGTGGANVSTPGPCVSAAIPWYEGGNSNVVNNVVGPCDNIDFILKAFNNAIWIKPTGKIGFNTANPNARFEITGTGLTDGIRYNSPNLANSAFEIATNTTYSRFKTYGNGQTFIGQLGSPANDFDVTGSMLTIGQSNVNYKAINVVNNASPSAPTDLFSVYGNGRTAIGTSNYPEDLLHVGSGVGKVVMGSAYSVGLNYGAGYIGFNASRNPNTNSWATANDGNVNGGSVIFGDVFGNIIFSTLPTNGSTNQTNVADGTVFGNRKFTINANGQVIVGTKTSVAHPTAAFMVNGTIVSKEIYVTKPADWPDYVFESDYKLLPLTEVEAFYKTQKHLPNVPSEGELTKTDISVAEMNALLLKKIEELTLYAVEQNKQLLDLKKEVLILKSK